MTPLVIDCESTGTDPAKDRLWQIAILQGPSCWSALCNPGVPIPQEVVDLCGLTPAKLEEISKAFPFSYYAADVAAQIHRLPIGGFNIAGYDLRLLAAEFDRAGVDYEFGPIIDGDPLYKQFRPRRLEDAARDLLGIEHVGAHDAEADARMTQMVLEKLTENMTIDEAVLKSSYGKQFADPPFNNLQIIDGRVCYGTRRNNAVPVENDLSYGWWMMDRDFPTATKRALQKEFDRIADDERKRYEWENRKIEGPDWYKGESPAEMLAFADWLEERERHEDAVTIRQRASWSEVPF